MTPLLNKCVDALAAWPAPWNQRQTGIVGPKELLGAISAAKVFLIDEAESDTTLARDMHPGYFATTRGFYPPAPVFWLEYKAYAPIAPDRVVWTGLRSAFLASDGPEGIITHLVSEMPWGEIVVVAGFGFEKSFERGHSVIEGKPIMIRTPLEDMPQLSGEGLQTGANFFIELVELVNMPVGVIRDERAPDRAFRRRLAKALGHVDFDLEPVTHIGLDMPDLERRARAGAA